MNMVEKVARAIDPEAWKDDLPVPTRADTIAFHEGRQASIVRARAAIGAMREPSQVMIDAMDDHAGTLAPHYAYMDAIDAALSEGKEAKRE